MKINCQRPPEKLHKGIKSNYLIWVMKGQKEFSRLRRRSFLDADLRSFGTLRESGKIKCLIEPVVQGWLVKEERD